MKKIRLYTLAAVSFLYAVTIYLLGYVLYVVSRLVLSLAYVFMLSPRSAKNELRDIHRVYQSFGDL